MGVEWQHGVFAADLELTGAVEMATDIDSLLREFDLVGSEPEVWVLDDGATREADEIDTAFAEGARNIGVRYDFYASHAIGEHLHGETTSRDSEDYYADISFVVGDDYRTFAAGEQAYTEVTTPPQVGDDELALFEPDARGFWFPTYDASTGCSPPVGEFVVGKWDPHPGDFTGIWRVGLLIDFGKSIPDWAKMLSPDTEPIYGNRDSEFTKHIVDVLGGSVHQFGGMH